MTFIFTFLFMFFFASNTQPQQPMGGLQRLQNPSSIETVRFNLQNNRLLPHKLTLIVYRPDQEGNNTLGLWMLPMSKRTFSFPVGTKLYLATPPQVGYVMSGKSLSFRGDTPFWIVKQEDQGRTIRLFGQSRSQTMPSLTHQITPQDLQNWVGNWEGKLTYLDYSSQKLVSIRSNLVVQQVSQTETRSFNIRYEYPDEPKANSASVLEISPDGQTIGDEKVVSKQILSDGTLQYITEKTGEDNQKPATFRFVHLLNTNSYSRRKEVRYNGESTYIVRHQYEWQR